MDDMQRAICDAFRQSPDIISDRQRLKSALADIIPVEKLMQNVILNAYDEDVVPKFTAGNNDIAMQALKLSRDLVDGYGLTDDSATWSVSTWCYMLGHDEVAELIGKKAPDSAGNIPVQQYKKGNAQYRSEYSFGSMYKAGKDFPFGNIQVIVKGKIKRGDWCAVYANKSPNKVSNTLVSNFNEKIYLDIKDNDYMIVRVIGTQVDFGYEIVEVG